MNNIIELKNNILMFEYYFNFLIKKGVPKNYIYATRYHNYDEISLIKLFAHYSYGTQYEIIISGNFSLLDKYLNELNFKINYDKKIKTLSVIINKEPFFKWLDIQSIK